VLVDQNISVPSPTLVHIRYSLVYVVHGPFLGPGLDSMVARELEHLGDSGGWGSDSGTSEVYITYNVGSFLETSGKERTYP
jgi:hypothetical protein